MNNMKLFLIQEWYPRNKSDADLAKVLNVDHSLVSKWLTGASKPPLDRMIQIAKALGVDSRLVFPEGSK